MCYFNFELRLLARLIQLSVRQVVMDKDQWYIFRVLDTLVCPICFRLAIQLLSATIFQHKASLIDDREIDIIKLSGIELR